jgi:hypothetical protein
MKVSRNPALVVLLVHLTCCACRQAPRKETTPSVGSPTPTQRDLFAGYPKTEALDQVVSYHSNAEWHLKRDHILTMTWFLQGRPGVAIECRADAHGFVSTYRSVHERGTQAHQQSKLAEAQYAALQEAVRQLPASAGKPELANLLIVSFRDGDRWVTRVYDRPSLPPQVERLYAITGAYLEADCGAFNHIMIAHRHGRSIVPGSHGGGTLMMEITWFPEGNPDSPRHCEVDSRGIVFACRYVHGVRFNYEEEHLPQLDEQALAKLRSVFEELPVGGQAGDFSPRLVIVSCQKRSGWDTAVYDVEALSAPVVRLCDIVGCSIASRRAR